LKEYLLHYLQIKVIVGHLKFPQYSSWNSVFPLKASNAAQRSVAELLTPQQVLPANLNSDGMV
jgi:hypothetical protein